VKKFPVYFKDGFSPTEADFLKEQEFWYNLAGWVAHAGLHESGLLPIDGNSLRPQDMYDTEVGDDLTITLKACRGITPSGQLIDYDAESFGAMGAEKVACSVEGTKESKELEVAVRVDGLSPVERETEEEDAASGSVAPAYALVIRNCDEDGGFDADHLVLGRFRIIAREDDVSTGHVEDFIPRCARVGACHSLKELYDEYVTLVEQVALGLKGKREELLKDPSSPNTIRSVPAIDPVRYYLLSCSATLDAQGVRMTPRHLFASLKSAVVMVAEMWHNYPLQGEFQEWLDGLPMELERLSFDDNHCAPQFYVVRDALRHVWADIERGTRLIEEFEYDNRIWRLLRRQVLPATHEETSQGHLYCFREFEEKRTAKAILLLLPKEKVPATWQGESPDLRVGLNAKDRFAMYLPTPGVHDETASLLLVVDARRATELRDVTIFTGENPSSFESKSAQIYTTAD
jgi:hypothetical protein